MKNPQDGALECDVHQGRQLEPVYEPVEPVVPKISHYKCLDSCGMIYDANGALIQSSEPVAAPASVEPQTDPVDSQQAP